ncbi:MAG: magnesium transporter [Planctomycetales bacterium]|nr:magnesium transporter [Planctomycetales bacterium]
MINTLFLPELREMLESGNSTELRDFCEALHPAATAEFMEGLTVDEAWRVLQEATRETRSEIFSFFDEARQIEILETQDREQVAQLIEDLAPDDRVDVLNEIEPQLSEQLIKLLPSDDRRETLRLQAYPEGTAGAVMTTEVIKLDESLTIRHALEQLQKQSNEVETIYYLYVVDELDHLRGVLSARDLISSLKSPEKTLRDLMETEPLTVDVHDDQEEVARKVAHYDLLAVPVVDDQHRFQGIITHDDIIDVVREEATEDAHRIAGVEPLDAGYLQTRISQLCWNRGVWLAPLFFAAMLTAKAMERFDERLSEPAWLWLFIPLVISAGGNSGNQSATLVITALTTGNVRISDWLTVVRRELLMGLLLGTLLAVVFLPTGWLVAPELNATNPMNLAVIPVTLLFVVCSGTIVGSILPLLFQRLGQDPALMSNPFVAGIVDILGILLYVMVAGWFLG